MHKHNGLEDIPNPDSRGKRLLVVHAGCDTGFLSNTLLVIAKGIKQAFADYHQNMDAVTFETWIQKQLIPALKEKEAITGRRQVLVMDNASYHSR